MSTKGCNDTNINETVTQHAQQPQRKQKTLHRDFLFKVNYIEKSCLP